MTTTAIAIAQSGSPHALLGLSPTLCSSVVVGASLHKWICTLAPHEQRKARVIHHVQDKIGYVAAHVLVRRVAADFLSSQHSDSQAVDPLDLLLKQRCSTCACTDHGQPSIAGHESIFVSLSHANGIVAAVASTHPVAIDVEKTGSAETQNLQQLMGEDKHLNTQSNNQWQTWLYKECLIKLGRTDWDGFCLQNPSAFSQKQDVMTLWQHPSQTAMGMVLGSAEATWSHTN